MMTNATGQLDTSPTMSKSRIASLTPQDIARLTFDEMVEVVISSQITVARIERIHEFDGDTVVRLVYSARQHCRQS